MFLFVGLGNPGINYANNRHNIGFMLVDSLAQHYKAPNFTKKFKSEFTKTTINSKICMFLKPSTFMNNSGLAVKESKDFFNCPLEDIFVFHDEIDINPGQIKIKNGGGHNGHNGLKSIDQFIGKGYNRVRIGVSRPSKIYENNINENISNWVLSDFSLDDKVKWLDNLIEKITANLTLLMEKEIDQFLKNTRQ
jgi:peptidyl-tRNA hydrolase, PTH1 family